MAERLKDWASLDDLILLNISKYFSVLDRSRASQVCVNWQNAIPPPDPSTIVRISCDEGCPKRIVLKEGARDEGLMSEETFAIDSISTGEKTKSRVRQLFINVCARHSKYGGEAAGVLEKYADCKNVQLEVLSLIFCSCDCDRNYYGHDSSLEDNIQALISRSHNLEILNLAVPLRMCLMDDFVIPSKLSILRLRTCAGGWTGAGIESIMTALSKLKNLQEFQFHLESLRDVLELIGKGELKSRSSIHLSVVCSNDPERWEKPQRQDWWGAAREMKDLKVSFVFEPTCSEHIMHACLKERLAPVAGIKLFLNKPLSRRRRGGGQHISLAESIQLHAPTLKYFSFAGPQGAVCDESMSSLLSRCTQLQKVTIYGSVKQETLDQWRQRYSQCAFKVLAHSDVLVIRKPPYTTRSRDSWYYSNDSDDYYDDGDYDYYGYDGQYD